MILLGTLYSVAGTVVLHIPFSDRVVNGLTQVLSGETKEDGKQDTAFTSTVQEIDTLGIATGYVGKHDSNPVGLSALCGRSDQHQDLNQSQVPQPALCYHTYCDTCDLLPTPSSFGINNLARNRSHPMLTNEGRISPEPHDPPHEYVAAQNDLFDDLVSRNLESLEATPKWWSPLQSPQIIQQYQFGHMEPDACLPTPPETAKRFGEFDILLASLPRDTKEHLLRKLQHDLESREVYDDTISEAQPFAETYSTASHFEKLDRFVHLCLLLTILLIRTLIPYLRSLYQQFREDRLYLLNRKNLNRTVDVVLSLMLALETSLQPGSRHTPWQVLSQLLAYPKKVAKQIITKRLASRKTQDNSLVGKWRRAAVEYVIKSFLSFPSESEPVGPIPEPGLEPGPNSSILATFNFRDSDSDYAQYFSPSYQPQKVHSNTSTTRDQCEVVLNDLLQTLAREL